MPTMVGEHFEYDGIIFYYQAHTGYFGKINSNKRRGTTGMNGLREDWKEMCNTIKIEFPRKKDKKNYQQRLKEVKELGTLREKETNDPDGRYVNLHEEGKTSEFVSPYTQDSCNVLSPVVFVLKDWDAHSPDRKRQVGQELEATGSHAPALPTNVNFHELLMEFFNKSREEVYSTNLFPFLKVGEKKKSSRIEKELYDKAFKKYCWPEIQIVKPKLVVCLGKAVYKTFRRNLKSH